MRSWSSTATPTTARSSNTRSASSAMSRTFCPSKAYQRIPFSNPHSNQETIMSNLSGKTALVTGASRGIGRASALALAKAGAQVLVHYGRGAAEAEMVVNEIRSAGGRADAVAADLANADGPHKLAAQVRRIVGDRLD